MRKKSVIISFLLLLLMVSTAHAASSSTVSAQDAASLVYVSSVIIDPPVFYPYEQGTITITLQNMGNQSVGLSTPDILSDKIHIINKDTWNTMNYIGSGSQIKYSFLVTADPPDGTYLPLFTIATKDSGSIHYPLIIKVDSTDIKSFISEQPDDFSRSTKDTVNLTIVNLREGAFKNIIITPTGTGIEVSPSEKYINSLNGESSVEVPFAVTPYQDSTLIFHISYQNGDNKRSTDVVLPINIGEDKQAAKPIVNNVAIVSQGYSYQLTGDVSNAGITDAKSMVLTVLAPARAVEPYASYAIGSLASDDFSSFELTFTSNDLSNVPLQIQWKDANGNTFSTVQNLDLRTIGSSDSTGTRTSSSGSAGTTGTVSGSSAARTGSPGGGGMFAIGGSRAGGISSFYPVIAGGIVIIIAIVLWIKRKWIAAKLKKR